MPRLRVISGRKLISIIKKQGFVIGRIKGSHVILNCPDQKDVVVVPLHKELDIGTLASILKKISPYLTSDFIKENFFK